MSDGKCLSADLAFLLSAEEPQSLLHLSRLCVRHALGDTRLGQISTLPLPPAMKRYLLYK